MDLGQHKPRKHLAQHKALMTIHSAPPLTPHLLSILRILFLFPPCPPFHQINICQGFVGHRHSRSISLLIDTSSPQTHIFLCPLPYLSLSPRKSKSVGVFLGYSCAQCMLVPPSLRALLGSETHNACQSSRSTPQADYLWSRR